ncbi:hypothetical protein TNCV_312001 [Trichonephila clavipes]|nr:hypothetical protein TNCV_312001 [Trichonephila clavipes]
MVLKANDRRTSCPCHDEFRGPRSDYVRQYREPETAGAEFQQEDALPPTSPNTYPDRCITSGSHPPALAFHNNVPQKKKRRKRAFFPFNLSSWDPDDVEHGAHGDGKMFLCEQPDDAQGFLCCIIKNHGQKVIVRNKKFVRRQSASSKPCTF